LKSHRRNYMTSQAGFTLIEVIIASAIGAMLLAGLSNVVLSGIKAWSTANNRVAASTEVRSFQFVAYDDFARSTVPTLPPGCGTQASPCTTQPLVLVGTLASNSVPPVMSANYQVTYTWDGTDFVDRDLGGNPRHAATDVSAFSWYVDTTGPNPTVVVSLTVTVPRASISGTQAAAFLGDPYSETQVFLFYPRLN
jgi:prepilin-type N-terminal cleavage/methylation domain-containing protein